MPENHLIDAKGLRCPMPVIKLQQAIRNAASGDTLTIECTDMGAEKDIRSWCKVNKHEMTDCIASETDFKGQITPIIRISVSIK